MEAMMILIDRGFSVQEVKSLIDKARNEHYNRMHKKQFPTNVCQEILGFSNEDHLYDIL